MSSYVESSLVQDETVLYQAALSKWAYFIPIFFGVILIPAVLGIVILIWVWIKFSSTELAVTDRRVIAKFGFISRKTFELNVDRVEGIQVDQSVMGRLFGFGTLRIAGAGNADPIPNISDPMGFKKAVNEAQAAARTLLRGGR